MWGKPTEHQGEAYLIYSVLSIFYLFSSFFIFPLDNLYCLYYIGSMINTKHKGGNQMTPQEMIQKAKSVACKPTIALNRTCISISRAKSLNITVNGPVSIKHGLIMISINIFTFLDFTDYSKRVVLNQNDFSLNQILPA